MTKREFINALEATPVSDDTEMILLDSQKTLDNADEDRSSEGVYRDFTIEILNENPTQDEIENFREVVDNEDAELRPTIAISFDNYDSDIESETKILSDRILLFNLAGEIAGTTIYNLKHPLDAEAQAKIHGLNENVAFIARDLFDKLNEQI